MKKIQIFIAVAAMVLLQGCASLSGADAAVAGGLYSTSPGWWPASWPTLSK